LTDPQAPAPRDVAAREASKTAVGVALLRLAHQLIDAEPRILDDPVAIALAGPEVIEAVRARADELQVPATRALRAHVLLRSRYAEDCLAEAYDRGVRQYVVLGAGGDTFAYRQPAWARDLRVIEVDHPASQQQKRARLAASRVVVPANVEFAAVDFETVSLAEGLVRAGFDLARPAFFSWLGVTMYLTEDAVDAVLAFVGALADDTEIVFTFAQRPTDDPRDEGRRQMAKQAAEVGEPWLSYFEPVDLTRKLEGFGFSTVSFLHPSDAERKYFAGRADALPAPRRATICRATV